MLFFPSNGFLEIDSDEDFGENSGVFEATKKRHMSRCQGEGMEIYAISFYIFWKLWGPRNVKHRTFIFSTVGWFFSPTHLKKYA